MCRTHALTDAPKAICPINFFKVGGINTGKIGNKQIWDPPQSLVTMFIHLTSISQKAHGTYKHLLEGTDAGDFDLT